MYLYISDLFEYIYHQLKYVSTVVKRFKVLLLFFYMKLNVLIINIGSICAFEILN